MNASLYRCGLILRDTAALRGMLGLTLLTVVGGFAVACSQGERTRTLSERVEGYWELKQAKRWDEVYDVYLDPEVRGEISREAFLEKRKLAFDILSYEVTETREDGEEATVRVTNEGHIPVPAGQGKMRMVRRTVTTADQWVRRDGVWYVALSG